MGNLKGLEGLRKNPRGYTLIREKIKKIFLRLYQFWKEKSYTHITIIYVKYI